MSRISQTIASGKHSLSLEFYPPKSEKAIAQLEKASQALRHLCPDFVSITYGAGGSTRKSTLNYAKTLKEVHQYSVMPHLTCVGHSRNELHSIIQQYQNHGFHTLMALRGDPQDGARQFTAHPDGFHYASELVSFIKEAFPQFEIGVGGYPEKHPEAATLSEDIQNLKKKIEAGADFITTQLFYRNEHYFNYVEACRNSGIDCPIVPGLMIPTALEKVERFCQFCQAELPETLRQALSKALGDPEATRTIALNWTYEQIQSLIENGAPGVHLYIMNQSEYALALHQRLASAGILKR